MKGTFTVHKNPAISDTRSSTPISAALISDTGSSDTREQLRTELTRMTTEMVNTDRPDLDTLDSLTLVREMNREDARVPEVVGGQAPQIAAAIAALADIAIDLVVGPEFVSGSTRLKSGTAQKLVLNMLSTISMIKLGKTYNGVMVDLQATNEKLQVRSELMVMHATGVDAERARGALSDAGGSVKEAILMLKSGLDRDRATEELARANGILRVAIENTLSSSSL